MSFSKAEAAITARAKELWTRRDIPLLWQNADRNIPAGPFLHVMIVGESERIAAYGAGKGQIEWDVDGRIEYRAFVPMFSGADFGRTLRDEFGAIFRGERFAGVTCYGVSPLGGASAADRGNFYALTAVVDFIYRFRG